MRPGAAVRLKGTWRNDSLLDASPETSINAEIVKAEGGEEASKTTAELQVSEVEVLGPSDPQVRLPSILSCFDNSSITYMNSLDLSDSEQVSDTGKPQDHLSPPPPNPLELHVTTLPLRLNCSPYPIFL